MPGLCAVLSPVVKITRNDYHNKYHASCIGVTLVSAISSWHGIWFLSFTVMNRAKDPNQKVKGTVEVIRPSQGNLNMIQLLNSELG